MKNAPSLPLPETAWNPISREQWDADCARHLLRRIGWTATPADTAQAVRDGPAVAVKRAFDAAHTFARPAQIDDFEENSEAVRAKIRALPKEEKKVFVAELRKKGRQAFTNFAVQWMQFARDARNAAREKLVMCLQDVFVVAAQKVKSPSRLFDHQQTLRQGIAGDYPALAKAVIRSPGMIEYLDLNRSSREAPNENFAREFFELFTLGEGNYSESDIKQAARAFTGIVLRDGAYAFAPRRHDAGKKTIFGETGNWLPDDVADIAFRQPAAERFFPGELVKFYLTENSLPVPYIEKLGQIWRAQKFNIRALVETFFNAQIFYRPEFRGTMIKSPTQYYLGLCQDLQLDVPPYAGGVLNVLRAMGQPFFDPPNVRGWIGGKNWINSTTLAARRQVALSFFQETDEENLNADDRRALEAARKLGKARLSIAVEQFAQIADGRSDAEIADFLITKFLAHRVSPTYRDALEKHIADAGAGARRIAGIRQAAIAILRSPEYQLC